MTVSVAKRAKRVTAPEEGTRCDLKQQVEEKIEARGSDHQEMVSRGSLKVS